MCHGKRVAFKTLQFITACVYTGFFIVYQSQNLPYRHSIVVVYVTYYEIGFPPVTVAVAVCASVQFTLPILRAVFGCCMWNVIAACVLVQRIQQNCYLIEFIFYCVLCD